MSWPRGRAAADSTQSQPNPHQQAGRRTRQACRQGAFACRRPARDIHARRPARGPPPVHSPARRARLMPCQSHRRRRSPRRLLRPRPTAWSPPTARSWRRVRTRATRAPVPEPPRVHRRAPRAPPPWHSLAAPRMRCARQPCSRRERSLRSALQRDDGHRPHEPRPRRPRWRAAYTGRARRRPRRAAPRCMTPRRRRGRARRANGSGPTLGRLRGRQLAPIAGLAHPRAGGHALAQNFARRSAHPRNRA
mmetsp:Transcript_2323/g.9291  ORF Transcript_2323/g.9291 Transcript_2323/m.9291 type:complete len:249 (+) Transcript_2323:170-916(+)